MRWFRNAVAAVLAFIAFLLTLYPPPALPLRWLPAVAAFILFVMYVGQQRPEAKIPPAHVEDMNMAGGGAHPRLGRATRLAIQYRGATQSRRRLGNRLAGRP